MTIATDSERDWFRIGTLERTRVLLAGRVGKRHRLKPILVVEGGHARDIHGAARLCGDNEHNN